MSSKTRLFLPKNEKIVRIIVGIAITKPIVTMSKRTPITKAWITSQVVVSPTRSRFSNRSATLKAKYIANRSKYNLKVILTKVGTFFILCFLLKRISPFRSISFHSSRNDDGFRHFERNGVESRNPPSDKSFYKSSMFIISLSFTKLIHPGFFELIKFSFFFRFHFFS